MDITLPEPTDVSAVVAHVLQREATARRAGTIVLRAPNQHAAVSLYAGPDGRYPVAAACDLAVVGVVGAVLGPPSSATDGGPDAALPAGGADALRSLFVAMEGLFSEDGTKLALRETRLPGQRLSRRSVHTLRSVTRRLDLQLHVDGHGTGHLSLLAV